jgi:DNA-directed RNA polymerase specialized sigma24 family protein
VGTGDGRSDDELAAAVGSRDHGALGEIYRRHGGAVWSIAKAVCRSAERAEDVCEQVFAELWSHPERFDPAGGGLRSWLVADAYARAVESDEADLERDCILLTYLGGHAASETARLLGVSEAVVKSSLRRGLLNMRQAQDAEGVSR